MANTNEFIKSRINALFGSTPWDVPAAIKRGNELPIDSTTLFQSKADADTYALGEGALISSYSPNGKMMTYNPGVAYPGQFLAVAEDDVVKGYIIGADKKLHELGAIENALSGMQLVLSDGAKTALCVINNSIQLSVGGGLIVENGVLSTKAIDVDQKIDDTTKTSSNPVATSAVVEYGKTAYDAAGTAQTKVDALEEALKNSYLPTNYLSVGVANNPTANNKLLTDSEVNAKINALDTALSTLTAAETLKSIKEVDGIIQIEKQDIQIDKSQVNGLTSDLGTIDTEITGLQSVSANHETRITTNESDITGLKQMSADLDAAIKAEKTRATAAEDVISAAAKDISATLGIVSSDYLKDADKTELQNSINTKLASEDFAKLSNDIGLSAATPANMVVTKKDIADLAGAMHFKGATANDWTPGDEGTNVPIPPYAPGTLSSQLSSGDIVIVPNKSKEYVWGGTKWIELGDESLYATKVALDQEITDRQTGDTNTLASAKTYANEISTSLSTDYVTKIKTVSDSLDAEITERSSVDESLQSQITTLSTTYILSSDVSAISSALNTALMNEVNRAQAAEGVLSTAIDNKVYVDGTKAEMLSIIHANADDYYQKVVAGTVLSNELYILSNDFVNAYGQQIKNVAAPTDLSDAVNKTYADAISIALDAKATAIDGRLTTLSTYTHALSVSQLVWDIDVISCGAASSFVD